MSKLSLSVSLLDQLKSIAYLTSEFLEAVVFTESSCSRGYPNGLKFSLTSYLKYYNLLGCNHSDISLTIGHIKVSDFHVVIQRYSNNNNNDNYKGIMFFIHGYLDHVGLYHKYFKFLLDNNYIVIAIDLPGHGLSSGKLGEIGDFGQYALSIEAAVEAVRNKYQNYHIPYYISGFSAGAAWVTEYLLRNRHAELFQKVILLAPLVRVPMWYFNKIAYYLSSVIKFVPRQPKKISHDPVFLNFVKYNDPLQPQFVPLKWVRAMHHWGDRLPKYKPLEIPALIIQGTEDQTIDWKYNIPNIIAKIFPNHQAHYIPGAYHNLCNESDKYREQVFKYIINYIS
ncbi:MAG: alpha/beta hydrolase [Gammaproteobacteria bacterium]|nr:alpha/beta hydrolase [Gammaproteobacteria bacterium]